MLANRSPVARLMRAMAFAAVARGLFVSSSGLLCVAFDPSSALSSGASASQSARIEETRGLFISWAAAATIPTASARPVMPHARNVTLHNTCGKVVATSRQDANIDAAAALAKWAPQL